MFHGCQKKIFYVKDTGSHMFSEAYFILRDGSDFVPSGGHDLAAEAERIIKEREHAGKKRVMQTSKAVLFLLGIALGAAGVAIAFALLK